MKIFDKFSKGDRFDKRTKLFLLSFIAVVVLLGLAKVVGGAFAASSADVYFRTSRSGTIYNVGTGGSGGSPFSVNKPIPAEYSFALGDNFDSYTVSGGAGALTTAQINLWDIASNTSHTCVDESTNPSVNCSDSFSALKGMDYTKADAASKSSITGGKYYIVYRNVGTYNGQKIDVKLSVQDYAISSAYSGGTYDGRVPFIAFYNDKKGPKYSGEFSKRVGVYVGRIDWIELKYEFFKSGTSTPVSLKGYTTYWDIDYYQGIDFIHGAERFYVNSNSELKWTGISSSASIYIFENNRSAYSGFDDRGVVTERFSGSSISNVFTFSAPADTTPLDRTTIKSAAGGIWNSTVVNTVKKNYHPNTAAGLDGTDVSVGDIITYGVMMTNGDSSSSTFRLTETLSKGLKYKTGTSYVRTPSAANIKFSEPAVTNNSDGTQTLVWDSSIGPNSYLLLSYGADVGDDAGASVVNGSTTISKSNVVIGGNQYELDVLTNPIEKDKVSVPTCSDKTYNGTEQTLLSNGTGYTIGNSGYTLSETINSRTGVIIFTLKDSNGNPISGARIDDSESFFSDVTDSSGRLDVNDDVTAILEWDELADYLYVTINGTRYTINRNSASPYSFGSSSGGNTGKNVGSYNVTVNPASGYQWSDGTTSSKSVTCKIVPKSVTITAKDQTINSGGSISTGTSYVNISSLVSGDSLYSVSLSQNDSTKKIIPSNAVIKSGSTDVTSNYSITYNPGNININEKPPATCPTITNYVGTYDGNSHTISVSGGSGGTIQYMAYSSGWMTGKPTMSGVTTTPMEIFVRVEGDSSHSTIECGSGTVTINKKALTITAKDQTIELGGTISKTMNDVTVSGLVSGHSVNSLTLEQSPSPASYATVNGSITPSSATIKNEGNTDVTNNYSITYHPGRLTVNDKPPATCPTLTNYSETYDGNPHSIGVSGGSGGTIQYKVHNDDPWTNTKPTLTNVGQSMEVYVRVLGDDSHSTANCGAKSIVISQRSLTITAKDQTIELGQTISKTLNDITVEGLISGHSVSAITLSQSTTSVTTDGKITPSAATVKNGSNADVTSNYSITYHPGKLVIGKDVATCPTLTDYSGTYDGNSHTIGVSGGSGGTIQYREGTTGSWISTKPTKINAGTTAIYVRVEGDSSHDSVDCGSKTITIGKKTLTPVVSALNKTYDGNTTATCSKNVTLLGIEGSDKVSATASENGTFADKNVGTGKTVTCTGITLTGEDKDNYTIVSSKTTTANITKKALVITADNKTMTYGGTVPTFTYTADGFVGGDTKSVLGGTAVYKVKNGGGKEVTVTPSLGAGTYSINPSGLTSTNYDITYNDGTLTVYGTNKELDITSTNDLAPSQTATLICKDEVGVSSYYFGTNSNPADADYIAVNPAVKNMSKTAPVTNDGKYYLFCKDTLGNPGEPVSKDFYKTTFVVDNGTVSPTVVLTMSGNSFNLLTPIAKDGYTMIKKSWYTDAELSQGAKEFNSTYKPTSSMTLYAGAKLNDPQLIVKYVDSNGKEISGSVVKTGAVGDSVTITAKQIESYKLVKKPDAEVIKLKPGNMVVQYVYEKIKYNITTKAVNSGGTLSGDQIVVYGGNSSKKIEIKANEGYVIKTVKINGVKQNISSGLQTLTLPMFEKVKENKLIEAEFEKVGTDVKIPDTGSAVSVVGVLTGIGMLGAGGYFIYRRYQNN